jgi:hypothetical protein
MLPESCSLFSSFYYLFVSFFIHSPLFAFCGIVFYCLSPFLFGFFITLHFFPSFFTLVVFVFFDARGFHLYLTPTILRLKGLWLLLLEKCIIWQGIKRHGSFY